MKTVTSSKQSLLNAILDAPASKPETQRALLLTLLSSRPVSLKNLSLSTETRTMFSALQRIGLTGDLGVDTILSSKFRFLQEDPSFTAKIDAANSALIARCAAWLSVSMRGTLLIQGGNNLSGRPFSPLFSQLQAIGATVEHPSDQVFPFIVKPPRVAPDIIELDRSISSQFVSAAIFYAIASRRNVRLEVAGRSRSNSYILQTISSAKEFGARIVERQNIIDIESSILGCHEYRVGVDFTSLSYYILLLLSRGGSITFDKYRGDSEQGERCIIDIFQSFGGHVKYESGKLNLSFVEYNRHDIGIDLSNAPNISPTVMAMAAIRPGTTHLSGMGITAYHKSSRVLAMSDELRKCGTNITVHRNEFGEYDSATIHGGEIRPSEPFSDHSDHRIYMSLFGLSQSFLGGAELIHSDIPSTSNEQFFADMKQCDVDFEFIEGT